MGELADAIDARRQQSRQAHGDRAVDEAGDCEVLMGTIGFVAGADHCSALNESDMTAIEQVDAPILVFGLPC